MRRALALLLALFLCRAAGLEARDFAREREWGLATINPHGLDYEIDYLSPAVHKWYGLRHLPETYMRPWYAADARYAREPYLRYVNRLLEGGDFYDDFGSHVGRGWLVYSWIQEQPLPRGSRIDKSTGGRAYERFFDRLVVAGDRRDGGSYRLMVGDEIYTRFTPLTLYKPRFNGARLDYGADRLLATLLLSRPSEPNARQLSDATHVVGGRAQVQLTENASLGLSYVNAHNARTERELVSGNPLRGTLTSQQNRPLEKIWVRVRDDSPGQGDQPAVLAEYEIVLEDRDGRQLRGREVGLLPKIVGGGNQSGRLVAHNNEAILLEYDLKRFAFENLSSADITRVRVELSLANDYQVEMASNLQTDGERFNPEIVFLPWRRAPGNVQDNSNTGFLSLDYGLPVASELVGADWNLADWHGLSLQGELVLNRRFFHYPGGTLDEHSQSRLHASASYLQAAYDRRPLLFFLEAFSMDDGYSTSYWLTDEEGRIRYKDPVPRVYEFVDDDDDLNGLPEWQRPFYDVQRGNITVRRLWNPVAFPGFDENGDFVNDHNQNGNLAPDYEEPFLRFRSDRPEFLFGLDMNHNGTIDRFENDDHPDYPYRRDHRGFNAYARAHAGPDFSLTLGRQDMALIAGDGRTRSWYALAAWERQRPGGDLRFFLHGARVQDNIADDLVLWFQPLGAPGRMRAEPDPLAARAIWKGVFYADAGQRLGPEIRLQHRFKWEIWRQRREGATDVFGFDGRRSSGFVGLVNRAEWGIPVGLAVLEPRWKSEYRRERPFSTRRPAAESLEQTLFLLWNQPLFAEASGVTYFPRYGRQIFDSQLQFGLERTWFWLLEGRREQVAEDFSGWTALLQITNRTAYQGYELVTRVGAQVERRHFAESPSQRSSLLFLTMNAGLGP